VEFKAVMDERMSRLGGDLGSASGAQESVAAEVAALQERVNADIFAEAKARGDGQGWPNVKSEP
jgi:hypothetical protein